MNNDHDSRSSSRPSDRAPRTSVRSPSREDDQGERTPRASLRPEDSDSSSRFAESSSSHQPHETSRLLTRDFADQDPVHRLRSVKSTAISFRQPSIRRRLESTQPSPSPAPSRPWRYVDHDRRSVAIAAPSVDDTASRKFSLAGPAPYEALNANQPYVDPGYAQLNPAYDQPANARPVWGLAKPLPHVLRPGMVPTRDELRKEVLQKDDSTEQPQDLESGRIEPSLRPGKIAAQLDDVRRQREIQLWEAFQQQQFGQSSPDFSPLARPHKGSPAPHRIPDIASQLGGPIIEEDEEYRHRTSDPALSGLSESVSKVNRAKEDYDAAVPYHDAIPLTAYEAEDDEVHNLHTYWSVVRLRFREPLAELLGVSLPLVSCNSD